MNKLLVVLALTLSLPAVQACSTPPSGSSGSNSVIGTWFVHDVDAPFPYHMYVFNSDGTLQQANPDAGDPNSSDSDGKGLWISDGDRVKGKWVEVLADRVTHKFTGRAEISFDIKVTNNSFAGTATAHSFDANDNPTGRPTPPGNFQGKRVTYP